MFGLIWHGSVRFSNTWLSLVRPEKCESNKLVKLGKFRFTYNVQLVCL
jgi:hypothetical protein